jgi:hypothetical protein
VRKNRRRQDRQRKERRQERRAKGEVGKRGESRRYPEGDPPLGHPLFLRVGHKKGLVLRKETKGGNEGRKEMKEGRKEMKEGNKGRK